MIYLVHFTVAYHHARHYLGFVDTASRDPEVALATRLDFHRRGQGSRLLRAVAQAGIEFEVVRTWNPADRNHERRLKGHSSTRLCPTCSGEGALRRGLYLPTTSTPMYVPPDAVKGAT